MNKCVIISFVSVSGMTETSPY